MKVRDIVVGGYYAVVPCTTWSDYEIRKGQVIAISDGLCRVRFRNPMKHDGWYFIPDKAGSKEHELEFDCFISTWVEYKTGKEKERQQRERLAEGIRDIQDLCANLQAMAEIRGFPDFSSEALKTYRAKDGAPVARITVSRDLLLALIDAFEKDTSTEGAIVSQLLGGNQ